MYSAYRHSRPKIPFEEYWIDFGLGFLINVAIYLICAFFHVGLPLVIPADYPDFYLGAIIMLSEFIFFVLFHEFIWKKTPYYMDHEEKRDFKDVLRKMKEQKIEDIKKKQEEAAKAKLKKLMGNI